MTIEKFTVKEIDIRPKYFTVKETARIVRRTEDTIRRWIEEGFLKEWIKVKDGYLIRQDEVMGLFKIKNSEQEEIKKIKISSSDRRETVSGYIIVKIPRENGKGFRDIPEHRFIMEQHLGRKLKRWEKVHHHNGIKKDNRLENLEIIVGNPHYGEVECPFCQNSFLIQ